MRRDLSGIGASRGAALGRARVRLPHALEVEQAHIEAHEVEAELARVHRAIAQVREEIHRLRERLHGALAHEVGEFLDLHALLLDDPELLQGLDDYIRRKRYTADYALRRQRDRIANVFLGMEDAYLRSRIDDIDQVIGRIHAALHQCDAELHGIAGDILVTDAIAPAEVAQLQAQGVLAVVTTGGSALSHSAILARSLHLPLVVGAALALQNINDGDVLAVDGGEGIVIREPESADLQAHRQRLAAYRQEHRQLGRLRREPTRTRDGVDIKLWANAESRADVAEAHALGAAGVGLYRTEFLFLGTHELPDEDTQFHAYRDLVLGLTGRTATLRTLDLGADKADDTGLAPRNEENPALGLRGIRLSLSRRDVFRTQLRAILRASGYGPLRILLPMVSGREEIRAARRLIAETAAELREAGHVVTEAIPLGAMIEVPAAAIALPGFIREVDFLSIGTNDLVQYLLAADRDNEYLGELYTPLHPALLRMLADVIRIGGRHARPVSVCGEMAGDAHFTPLLLALGLTEFSLHPGTLLEVRRTIRNADLTTLRKAGRTLLRARDRAAIEHWMRAHEA
ncbi:phosphoenolpyruvate--protein phosphotransferase [Lysobacter pythonis]|uniref:Phosphoenolpyruvate-protein phosphotransferase n=1 Tax=Solilutibacter pythonis TaxID=2483112 RepID=A0A3M2I176_9GAMM|nr:phosphoenolpyruvate--protein phosphotransferase [Lysobacter pythonis]RMH94125.1 phosphoenolpyruvate--protein phosphotransferase [Lysobacter pythonis]